MDKIHDKQNKMGSMPIKKLLFTMSLPSIFGMLMQALYNVIDSIFVSRISQDALSAVTLAFPIQMIIISLCVGGGIGINSLISRRLGEGKNDEANNVAEHGILIMLAIYLLVFIFTVFFSDRVYQSFSNDIDVVGYGCVYVKIILFFSFGRLVAQSGMSILEGTGDMANSMKARLLGIIVNIILDPILIYGWFGIPSMGVKGAAISTVVGQIITMIYIFIILIKKENYIKINLKKFHFKYKIVKDILVVGIPAMVMQGIMSIMLFGMNWVLATYDELASTAFGVYYKIQTLIFLPVIGLGKGVLPIIGYNYGAKNKERVMATIKYGLIWSISFMTLGMIVFQIFPQYLLKLFNSSDEMTKIGVRAFRIISLSFPFAGATVIISNMFQAIGKSIYSMIISVLRQLVILLPIACLLGFMFGLNYLWYSYIISDVVGMSISILIIKLIFKKDLKLQ